ncbi:lipid A deacylase LpxR family protein [Pedobacter sp. MW01-1-1]|uniref:lipid A deacylase LpxR family protein n=1 Tax=Pedobacter sp. MW01-1-1 TaxID=3383027 RepID=UPI003FF053BE
MKSTSLVAMLLCCLYFSAKSQNFTNEVGFKTENDAYLSGTNDRYYTNGLFLYYRHALNTENSSSKIEKKTYEISVGQKMYTPYWGFVPDFADQDRPFAGYLYAGGAYSVFFKNEGILKTSIELGTVGPNALAEDAQEFLHETIGFYHPEGWEYQIQNEAALNLSASYNKLVLRSRNHIFDFSASAYVNLGTTFSGLGIAPLFRLGELNQLFNSAMHHAVIGQSKTKAYRKEEFYVYYKPQLNYVAYDATVQGSMFHNNSPLTFDIKPWVVQQQFGVNYSSKRFTADFSAIFVSQEIESTAKPQYYGSLSLYYRFGKN